MGTRAGTGAGCWPARLICYAYVFPCVWEDHCKVGFSRDPLSRLMALHRRWFDFFDLERAFLVEAETERDARDLELELRRPLSMHKAPMPLTVCESAGGRTEWLRGAYESLQIRVSMLEERGHTVHAPLRQWLRQSLKDRSDRLYSWTLAQLGEDPGQVDDLHRAVRNTLDAYAAVGVDIEPLVAPHVYGWYRDARV